MLAHLEAEGAVSSFCQLPDVTHAGSNQPIRAQIDLNFLYLAGAFYNKELFHLASCPPPDLPHSFVAEVLLHEDDSTPTIAIYLLES